MFVSKVVIPSLTSIHLHLLWNLHDLDEANPERSTMRTIKSLTDKLVKHCHDLMKLGSPDTQKQAYSLLCDLLVVFSKQLKTRGKCYFYTIQSDSISTLVQ